MFNYQVYYRINTRFAPPEVVNLSDYKFIAEVEATDLEDLFEKMNNGHTRSEILAKLRVRSLSVGDVVINKGSDVAMICDYVGWKPVQIEAVQ